MKTRNILLSILALTVSVLQSQNISNQEIARNIANNLLRQPVNMFVDAKKNIYTTTADIPAGTDVKFASPLMEWHYANGILNMAMINVGKYLNEPKYIQYALNHTQFGFDNYEYFKNTFRNDRKHWHWPFGQLWNFKELDDCGAMGASIVDILNHTKDPKYTAQYEEYIKNAANHVMKGQLRLKDGTLARTFPHNRTVWADDMYMGVSLLAKMGARTGDKKYFDEGAKQIIQIGDYLWCPEKQLYYHCYYTDLKRNGVAFWGRANGWVAYSTCMLLDVMPENHPKRKELIKRLERQIVGFSRYQNANGMWHQLLDKSDSYEESSVSALFVYSVAKAINKGWISNCYKDIAVKGWNALKKSQITPDGKFQNVCVGTGIADEQVFYYTRPVGDNEKHGLGLVLDAVVEMMILENKK